MRRYSQRETRLRRIRSRSLLTGSLILLTLQLHSIVHAQSAIGLCGDLANGYGPYDYRTIPAEPKRLVEIGHFTPNVETLQRGQTGHLGSDLDYTLRAIPNHPRALYAMTRLGEREHRTTPRGARYPVECYYDRAIRFRPDDTRVRALYAIFLIKNKRPKEALPQLELAEGGADDPEIAYNLGLAWFDLENYDKSMAFAAKAYASGITVPGLKQKLQRVGKWRNPG